MTVIDAEPVLSARDLGKRFFGREAVLGFSIDLYAGAVHGLYGSAGSGKTTLVRMLTGALLADEGDFAARGRVVASGRAHGLLPGRTVAANLYLGREPRTGGVIDRERMLGDAAEFLAGLGVGDIDPGIRVHGLDAVQLRLVECACAVAWGASLFIVDDSVLDEQVQALLRRSGLTVLQLSDDLVGLLEHCDTVTML